MSFSRKFERAGRHIDDLREAAEAWVRGNPYRVVLKPKPEPGGQLLCAHVPQPPDPILSIVAGDAVHALRSALDHLAFALAVSNTEGPLDERVERASEFPIFPEIVGDRTGSEAFHQLTKKGEPAPGSGLHKLQGVHPDAVAEIEGVQPYHRGAEFAAHPLWRIHELDRIDKHRRLNLMGHAIQEGSIGINEMAGGAFHLDFVRGSGPVNHGDILASFWATADVQYQGTFSFDVTLGEGPPGPPLVPALTELRDYVRSEVIPPLAAYL